MQRAEQGGPPNGARPSRFWAAWRGLGACSGAPPLPQSNQGALFEPKEVLMLVKVKASQLQVGMRVVEFCGAWIENPFWSSNVLLKTAADVEKLQSSGVEEVVIDTSQGVALEAADDPVALGGAGEPTASQDALEGGASKGWVPKMVPLEQEAARAVKICELAKDQVRQMFSDARMGRALDAAGARSLVEEISNSITRNPSALISVARLKTKDQYTYMHSVAVCALMVALARQLGFDDQDAKAAGLAGLVHDIGKLAVPLEILNKPGALSAVEFATIKSHPAAGHAILSKAPDMPASALDVCLHHHEKFDGTGYPKGLKGEEISLLARMGAVCDVYDAVTSERPYKRGWSPAEAIGRMAEWSGKHFDERVFKAFVKSVGIYPTGSLVRLESQRLAVVCEQGASLLQPVVRAFYSTRSQTRFVPERIDLAKSRDKIASREEAKDWGFDDLDALWRD
jgi:putative nucleotidyltransferase with HDIG domain